MSNSLFHIVELAYFTNVRTKLNIIRINRIIRIIRTRFRNIVITTKGNRLGCGKRFDRCGKGKKCHQY